MKFACEGLFDPRSVGHVHSGRIYVVTDCERKKVSDAVPQRIVYSKLLLLLKSIYMKAIKLYQFVSLI
jgi:hypothetical protein